MPCLKSTSVSVLFYNGCMVSQKSRKQFLVVLSTTNADIVALVNETIKHEGIQKLFEEPKFVMKGWNTNCQNQVCIKIAHETGYSEQEKDIRLSRMYSTVITFSFATVPRRPTVHTFWPRRYQRRSTKVECSHFLWQNCTKLGNCCIFLTELRWLTTAE